jgi:hypothetical protein
VIDVALRSAALLGLLDVAPSCAPAVAEPPAFEGRETDAWMAYEVRIPGRNSADLIPSFEASANAFGCHTTRLGTQAVQIAGGSAAILSYGVSATCEEGSIALVALADSRVRIGCEKPTTRARCDGLLRQISERH